MCGVCESSCECCQHKLGVVRKREIAVATGRHFTGSELKSRWENKRQQCVSGKGSLEGKELHTSLIFYCEGHRAGVRGSCKKNGTCKGGEIKPTRNEKHRTKWGPQKRQQSFVRGIGAEEKWNTLHQETESFLPHREGYELRETQQVTAIPVKRQHDQGSRRHRQ